VTIPPLLRWMSVKPSRSSRAVGGAAAEINGLMPGVGSRAGGVVRLQRIDGVQTQLSSAGGVGAYRQTRGGERRRIIG
jgi:hypothetical protein